ncbi:MAG: SCO family protein [Steroidobacteraceae bacterium]|jgi:protein SCO1/2|nr:SCO family protein [Steroidobacteraceae bacterium]
MTSRRRAAYAATLPGVVLLGLLAACSGGSAPPSPPFNSTEVSGIDYGRGLRIPDTAGTPRSLEDFRGRVVVVFFGFTSCPDVCPTTLARLKMVRNAMGADGERLQVVLVSVDPERDAPEKLAQYARSFDPSFVALRPEPAALDEVTKAFRAIAVKVPPEGGGDAALARGEYTVDHSGTLYVYDRANRLRLIAQPDFDVPKLAADLQRLAREPA